MVTANTKSADSDDQPTSNFDALYYNTTQPITPPLQSLDPATLSSYTYASYISAASVTTRSPPSSAVLKVPIFDTKDGLI